MLIGEMRGFGQGSAPPALPMEFLPPEAVAQIRVAMEAGADAGAGRFVPATTPMSPAQAFWIKHKDKVFIGGAVGAGALIVYLLAR